MLIVGEGLILLYICKNEPTASTSTVQLPSICGQTDPTIRNFALLYQGKVLKQQ